MTDAASRLGAPPNKLTISGYLSIAGVIGLIALGLVWESKLAPLKPGGSWLILKILPLAMLLAPLLKFKPRAFQWLALLIQMYICEGALRLMSDQQPIGRALAALELLLAGLCFAAALVHIRQLRRVSAPEMESGR